jgi:hypothetical protein
VLLSDLILATGLRHAIVDDDAPAPRPAGASFRMEGGPGGAVRGWLEFASVGELLSFLQRLGVDGRGVEASALFDIADDVAGSHPALSGSVLERMQAGAPMPARPAHPWDRGAFASRPDRAQPPFTAGTAGGGGSSTASSYGGSGGPSAVGADGDMPFLPSQLSGGELAALGPAAQRVVGALLSRVESLEGLLDPAARFEYMAQVAVEPPMRAILDGRLSAADVRAVRAYPISPAAIFIERTVSTDSSSDHPLAKTWSATAHACALEQAGVGFLQSTRDPLAGDLSKVRSAPTDRCSSVGANSGVGVLA